MTSQNAGQSASSPTSQSPDTVPCPIPNVASALEPYIRTRLDAQRIRAGITTQLHASATASLANINDSSSWRESSVSVSQLTLGSPPGNSNLSTDDNDFLSSAKLVVNPSVGSGSTSTYTPESVRRYISALSTLRRAQARYNDVKTELSELQQQCNEQSTRRPFQLHKDSTSQEEGSDVRARISALRLSQRRARLEAVGKAVDSLAALQSNPLDRDVKTYAKNEVGDVPEPPSSNFAAIEIDGEDSGRKKLEDLVFELKKALVVAGQRERKARDEEQSARNRCERMLSRMDGAKVPGRVKLEAMAKAREELVAWVEGELSKVSAANEEEDDESEVPEEEETEMTEEEVNAQVQELYQIYVSARHELVQRVDRLLKEREKISPDKTATTAGGAASNLSSPRKRTADQQQIQDSTGPRLSASEILPYLPTLMQVSREETALLQQTSHLRKQLNLSATETQAVLQRLAGESHLVPPDTNDTAAWEKSANEFARNTEEAVREHVGDGMDRVDGAREALGEMFARRKALETVKGKFST